MELTISSPCPKKWTDLVGNDRIRYCGDCKLNVYNLAELRPAEIEALVRKTPGRLCGQLYVRQDRTATLWDCPTARAGALRRRIWKIAAGFSVVIVGLLFRGMQRPDTQNLPPWLRTVASWIDPEPEHPPVRMVGEITCVPRPPALPPTAANGAATEPKAGP